MRARLILATGTAMLLAGCATHGVVPSPGSAQPAEADTIAYETQPCFGACPVYTVTVSPDGQGTFTGKRFTAVSGERDFTVDRATYRHFAAALAPYRPAEGAATYRSGSANCGPAPTDMPSVDVTWTDSIGATASLHFYLGCRARNPHLAAALAAAPDLLPIATMIGRR